MKPINIPTSARIFWWQPAAWFRVTGPDAANFLQGQFTNDLRGLARGAAVYGLWLNVKAKVVADSFVVRGRNDDEFWIGSYFSSASVVLERLESHIIADDVTIEDATAGWRGVTWFGASEEVVSTDPSRPGFQFRGRRAREETLEWVYPLADEPAVRERLGAVVELSDEDITRFRIEAGIPAVPVDLGAADLPNEGGLEVSAISYTKGCYLGQEVIARLKSMGQVRRRLLRARGAGESIPVLPAAVFAGVRRVGELRSAVGDGTGGFIGLAMLSLLHITPGATFSFAPDGTADLRLLDEP